MFQRRAVEFTMVAVPLLGVRMLVMTKSEFTISLMTILVAPVLEMLAASSAEQLLQIFGIGG